MKQNVSILYVIAKHPHLQQDIFKIAYNNPLNSAFGVGLGFVKP